MDDVVGGHGDVLHALTVVAADVFHDLALLVRGLVDGDDDLVVEALDDLGIEAGAQAAADVEFAGDRKAVHAVVEGREVIHLAWTHVVREVVDPHQAWIAQRRQGIGIQPWPEAVQFPCALHEHVPDLAHALNRRDAEGSFAQLEGLDLLTHRGAPRLGLGEGGIEVGDAEVQGADALAVRLEVAASRMRGVRLEHQDVHALLPEMHQAAPGADP